MIMEIRLCMSMKMVGKMIILALVTVIILVSAASAIPPLPCEYHGQVLIDGAPAPTGTIISAAVNGAVRGMMSTGEVGSLGGTGTFDHRLVVSATEADTSLTASPDVVFYVDGIRADVVDSFGPGESHAVALSVKSLKTVPSFTAKPTDPDGDFVYEDLNGNGRLDFADVVLYFNQMEWMAANEPVSAFDLNGNGRIDFADIVKLFGEI
jgi:PKD repeat protein